MKQDNSLGWVFMICIAFVAYLFAVSPQTGRDFMLEIAGFLMLLPFIAAVAMLFWAGLTALFGVLIDFYRGETPEQRAAFELGRELDDAQRLAGARKGRK